MERRRTFSREFKLEAVKLVTERGVTVAQAAKDLDVHENVLRKWVRELREAPQEDEKLGAQVRQSFMRSDCTYGARHVWRDVLEQSQPCGLHRIERLMREQALRARPRRRGLPKDCGERCAVADNVLDRQFQADAPNQKWVADFTYIWTAEGWLYVAAMLDLYSRRIVGWSMQESMTSQLVVDALMPCGAGASRWHCCITRTRAVNTRVRTSSSCCASKASPAA